LTFKQGTANANHNYGLEETSSGNLVAKRVHANGAQYGITEFDAGDLRLSRVVANHEANYGIEETSTGSLLGSHVTVRNGQGYGAVKLTAVTITRNVADREGSGGEFGGGIFQGGGTSVQVRNSLIAKNDVAPGAPILKTGFDCFGESDPLDSKGHNLIGKSISCNGFDAPGDQVDKNPKVAKLADNGGPTKTVALEKGSPAIGRAAQ